MSSNISGLRVTMELQTFKDANRTPLMMSKLNEGLCRDQGLLAYDNRVYYTDAPDDNNHIYYDAMGEDASRDTSTDSPEEGHYEMMSGRPPSSADVHSSMSMQTHQLNCPTSPRRNATDYDDVAEVVTNTAVTMVTVDPKQNELLDQEGQSLHIIKRLGIGKGKYPFCNYVSFTVKSIYEEVDAFAFLDLFYILSGIIVLACGARDFNRCPMSTILPFLVVGYGFFSIVFSLLFFSLKLRHHPIELNRFLTIVYRVGRIFMSTFCILGMMEIYMKFPPDQSAESPNYCSPYMYWSALYIFTLTACTMAAIFLHTGLAIVWYFI